MDKKILQLSESEYYLADIVWEREPLKSSELVKICEEKFGWKKSTTYTLLKRLELKAVLVNNNTILTSKIKREEVEQYVSCSVVDKTFKGSLPGFVAAFLKKQKLTTQEIEELYKLIEDADKKENL